MQLNYGTSGFRYPVVVIHSIAFAIGQAVCLLSHQHKQPVGIMITASHNPHTDNGVKLVQHDGCMISPDDESFMVERVLNKSTISLNARKSTLIIGMDTRPSSDTIKKLIIRGIQSVDTCPTIIDLSWTTTPQLHYHTFYRGSRKSEDYYESYFNDVNQLEFPHIVVDCANGVGTFPMRHLVESHQLQDNVILCNTNMSNSTLLNHLCGSDFISNHLDLHHFQMDHVLHASLDGDADRLVCYLRENERCMLLDGDYLSALFAFYLHKCENVKDIRVGVIHTAYANSAFLSYIDGLGFETRCTATGVKHLHRAALDYDIGIYFESNGHGTVLFKPQISSGLKQWLNPFIGDGVADLFAVLFALQELDITPKQWYQLFDKRPSNTYKLCVKDKTIFKTTQDETRLITPYKVQERQDEIMKNKCRIFIRPSGTENVVRLHIEGNSLSDIDEFKILVRNAMREYI